MNIARDTFRRIEGATKGYERRDRDPGPTTRGPRIQVMGRWFRTTSALSAATFAASVLTMPTGTAAPYDVTLGSGTASDTATASGEPDLRIANGLNAAIASGKIVHAVSTGGRFIIDLVWCG